MAQQQSRRSGAGAAFLWGGIFGVVVIALRLAERFVVVGRLARVLRLGLRPVPGMTLLGIMLSLAALACYFVAGLLAARRAGRIEPGIFAGLIAGGIAGLGTLVLAIIGTALARQGLRVGAAGGIGIGVRGLVVAGLASAVVGMLTSTVVGTGMGALGALVGRPRSSGPQAGGWSPAYQAGPGGMVTGVGHAPVAPNYPSEPSYPPHTPPLAGYATSDDSPTIQTDGMPPTP